MKRFLVLLIFVSTIYHAKSQVLISLLFGDKLNSPDVEFGLDGGVNWGLMSDFDSRKLYRKFNLGFYFTFRLKQSEHWFLRTGCMVKSERGLSNLSVNDVITIDNSFLSSGNGSYSQKLGYFDVPMLIRYRFGFNGFLELGGQVSLRNNAEIFYEYDDGDDLISVSRKNVDDVNLLDAGLVGGVGYQLHDTKSLSVAFWYYKGLTNVYNNGINSTNQSLNLKLTIPIGAGKAANNDGD